MQLSNEIQLRFMALQSAAMACAGRDIEPAVIVDNAKVFYEYLTEGE